MEIKIYFQDNGSKNIFKFYDYPKYIKYVLDIINMKIYFIHDKYLKYFRVQ